jgi:hypothetical protein
MASSSRPRGSRYTIENLSAAVAASTSYHGVLRHLGMAVTGGGSTHVSRRIKDFGIDVSHFTSLRPAPAPFREIGREEFTTAFQDARSLADLARRLGLPVSARTRRFLSAEIARYELNLANLGHQRSRYDPDQLAVLARRCSSLAEMMRSIGLDTSDSGNYRKLRRALRLNGIDTSHFTRSSWADPDNRPKRAFDPGKVLRYRDTPTRTPGDRLRLAMTVSGVPEICRRCGLEARWRGQRLTLEVDHIDGDFRNNRLENLRFLCPNCHAITNTYCRRKAAQTR